MGWRCYCQYSRNYNHYYITAAVVVVVVVVVVVAVVVVGVVVGGGGGAGVVVIIIIAASLPFNGGQISMQKDDQEDKSNAESQKANFLHEEDLNWT
jgi:hypothetical protein